jgi:exodeoxyribonuclease VII small subunit
MPSKKNAKQVDSSQEAQPLEALIARLEEIARLIQEGQVGLEESIALYEEGQRIARLCTERLTAAQRKLDILSPVRASEEALPPDTTDPHLPQSPES